MSEYINVGIERPAAGAKTDEAAKTSIQLGTIDFQKANEIVREALDNADVVELNDVFAQRFLGASMPHGKRLEIHGIPGNDMGCYMDGGQIEVFGNAQDQIGNTMNDGCMVVHGRCGDAAGYAMRGGQIFIRDDSGWRVGIHMKQFKDKCPIIVIGGNAGSFLGEYMAGGIIVLLGDPGDYLATGMHGGVIYLAHKLDDSLVAEGLVQNPVDSSDIDTLQALLDRYSAYFADESDVASKAIASDFYKLSPATSRPYASLYAN